MTADKVYLESGEGAVYVYTRDKISENSRWKYFKNDYDIKLQNSRKQDKQKETSLESRASPVAGNDWAVPGIGMEFVWIKALRSWVGKYEVTNGEYRKFKQDHRSGSFEGHSLDDDRQPAVCINYDDAAEYTKWLTERELNAGRLPAGCSYRLPTGNEWTAFCQCGDNREYPWGSTWPPKYGNYAGQESTCPGEKVKDYDDGFPVTCPVEMSGRNDWGLYGIGGNAWECTVKSDSGLSFDAWRGASWSNGGSFLMVPYRVEGFGTQYRTNNRGFRLVLAPMPSATVIAAESKAVVQAELSSDAAAADAAVPVRKQTLCPKCHNKIEKKYYLDSDGKRVYFCSSFCAAQMKKDIADVITKLEAGGVSLQAAMTVAGIMPATEMAERWLKLLDNGEYRESWMEAGTPFRQAITVPAWIQRVKPVRVQVGKLLSRKLKSVTYENSLPGAVEGHYAVIQYETSFGNKIKSSETVITKEESDGKSRVYSYTVW